MYSGFKSPHLPLSARHAARAGMSFGFGLTDATERNSVLPDAEVRGELDLSITTGRGAVVFPPASAMRPSGPRKGENTSTASLPRKCSDENSFRMKLSTTETESNRTIGGEISKSFPGIFTIERKPPSGGGPETFVDLARSVVSREEAALQRERFAVEWPRAPITRITNPALRSDDDAFPDMKRLRRRQTQEPTRLPQAEQRTTDPRWPLPVDSVHGSRPAPSRSSRPGEHP